MGIKWRLLYLLIFAPFFLSTQYKYFNSNNYQLKCWKLGHTFERLSDVPPFWYWYLNFHVCGYQFLYCTAGTIFKHANFLKYLKNLLYNSSQCSLRAKKFNLVLRSKFNLFLVLMHEGNWKQIFVKSYHSVLLRYWGFF